MFHDQHQLLSVSYLQNVTSYSYKRKFTSYFHGTLTIAYSQHLIHMVNIIQLNWKACLVICLLSNKIATLNAN